MALSTDLVRNAAPNFATTLANSMLISDTTMTPSSVTGLPTATGITLVIDATDPVSGEATPALKEVITGVISGGTVASLVRGLDGTSAIAHASGANVVLWITANLWNDFQTSYLTQHKQLGTHGAITADSITTTGNASVGGTLGVTGAATLASLVLNGALTGTGLAGQVQSFVNVGTGGGTFYYINMAGIKDMWGVFPGIVSGTTNTLTLPAFFTTLQTITLTGGPVVGTSAIETFISTQSTSSIVVGLNATTGSGTMPLNIFIRGT